MAIGRVSGARSRQKKKERFSMPCAKSRSRRSFPSLCSAPRPGRERTRFARRSGKHRLRCSLFAVRQRQDGRRQWKADSLEPAGAGILTFRAAQFPDRKPEHFVFATERYGLDGEAGYLAGRAVPYSVDAAKPMGSWKTAWKAAARKGDPEDASAKPLACRIHDLRQFRG
jgi:hypothetical protein